MTLTVDLRERVPAQELMEKLAVVVREDGVRWLPFGIAVPSRDWLSWLRGVRGELEVAKRLDRLGPEWTVLHSVPLGGGARDLDHLAIGPGGVFTISTKRSIDAAIRVAGGVFMIAGRKLPYLRNAEQEARRVAGLLAAAGVEVPVSPVIAVSGAKSITVTATPEWDGTVVHVIDATGVGELLDRRQVLDADAVERIVAAALSPETWAADERTGTDAARLRAIYRQLDRGLGRWNLLMRLVPLAISSALGALVISALPH